METVSHFFATPPPPHTHTHTSACSTEGATNNIGTLRTDTRARAQRGAHPHTRTHTHKLLQQLSFQVRENAVKSTTSQEAPDDGLQAGRRGQKSTDGTTHTPTHTRERARARGTVPGGVPRGQNAGAAPAAHATRFPTLSRGSSHGQHRAEGANTKRPPGTTVPRTTAARTWILVAANCRCSSFLNWYPRYTD